MSQHLTHNQFKLYLTQVWSDVNTRVHMFVIRPAGDLPVILEVGKEKKTLAELGVEDLTTVVVYDADADCSADKPGANTGQLYHLIAKNFDIPLEEYQALVPKY